MPMPRLRPLRFPLALAALLALAPSTYAQPPIEQQMTPEQFRAAGLEKLSPQELAHLNAWLNNTLEVETTKAAALAKDKIETENRGFLPTGKRDPIVAKIAGEFRGFAIGRTIFGAPARDWLAGTIDDETAVARVAAGYARMIEQWRRRRPAAAAA